MKLPGTDHEISEIFASDDGRVHVFGSAANHPYSVCVALSDKYAQITISEAVELSKALLLAAQWAYENSARDGVWISKDNGDDIRAMGYSDVKILNGTNN